MKNGPYNHTIWKHMWELALVDVSGTKWLLNGQAKKSGAIKVKGVRLLRTGKISSLLHYRSVKHSTVHRPRIKGQTKPGTDRLVGPRHLLPHSHKRTRGSALWDSNVCRKTDQWSLCCGTKIQRENWAYSENVSFVVGEKRLRILSPRLTINVKHFVREHDQEATIWPTLEPKARGRSLLTKVTNKQTGRQCSIRGEQASEGSAQMVFEAAPRLLELFVIPNDGLILVLPSARSHLVSAQRG